MKINDKGRWNYMGGMNPTYVGFNARLTINQHAITMRHDYTVPEGKAAILGSMSAGISNVSMSGVPVESLIECILTPYDSAPIIVFNLFGTLLNAFVFLSTMVNTDIPLRAGDKIELFTENLSVDQTNTYFFNSNIIEFDK